MSRAIASARQRRAGITSSEPIPAATLAPPASNPTQGLTLPQVINLVDIRLMKLEKFMADTQNQPPAPQVEVQPQSEEKDLQRERENELIIETQKELQKEREKITAFNQEVIDEFEHRFKMLATEIANIKDILLKLQSYTMDVNRSLLEEKEFIQNQQDSKSFFTLHNVETATTEEFPLNENENENDTEDKSLNEESENI